MFSIAAGILVLVVLAGGVLQRKLMRIGFIERSKIRLQKIVAEQLKRKSLLSMFAICMSNGFLPCGLVYLALTAAMAAGSLQSGIFFMTAYGAGTLPAMFAISYFGTKINLTTRNAIKKMLPYGVAIVGILLILRGMNLNIPFVSPFFDNSSAKVINCH
jgi:sulfite exporter TauE/SafE